MTGGIPRIVIVGRPNVGKSTLFNALAGRRVAIEDPMAGVTRDRIGFVLDQDNRSVELIDTGGIGQVDEALLADEIEEQIAAALDLADLVLFVVDAKAGVVEADRRVAARLRPLGRPVVLVANKVEAPRDEAGVGEAHALGFGEPVAVSAKERLGIADLRELVFARAGDAALRPFAPDRAIRLGIVGRMNVGKSTLVNTLVGERRQIVSDVPGTTRDAVDVAFTAGGRRFVAIDTAGIRKARAITDSVEFYGQSRAERAIRRSDVVLLMLDATRDVGRIDKRIAGDVVAAAVPAVIVVNKWDLARDRTDPATYTTYLRRQLAGLPWAPISFLSAARDEGVAETLTLAAELHEQAGRRVGTGELNRVLRRAWAQRKPRARAGRIGKVYYASQVGTYPPTIVVFVNAPEAFDDAWRRFLVHEIQERLPFPEIPVRLRLLPRGRGRPRVEDEAEPLPAPDHAGLDDPDEPLFDREPFDDDDSPDDDG